MRARRLSRSSCHRADWRGMSSPRPRRARCRMQCFGPGAETCLLASAPFQYKARKQRARGHVACASSRFVWPHAGGIQLGMMQASRRASTAACKCHQRSRLRLHLPVTIYAAREVAPTVAYGARLTPFRLCLLHWTRSVNSRSQVSSKTVVCAALSVWLFLLQMSQGCCNAEFLTIC